MLRQPCRGGGPKGERNGAYRTGRYIAEAKAERRELRLLLRELRSLIDSSELVYPTRFRR